MRSIKDIHDMLARELRYWFIKQCHNPLTPYYLYYLLATNAHGSGLLITSTPPISPEYKLAMPDKLSMSKTIPELQADLLECLYRLPLLSRGDNIPTSEMSELLARREKLIIEIAGIDTRIDRLGSAPG